jgi:hypothetical protein
MESKKFEWVKPDIYDKLAVKYSKIFSHGNKIELDRIGWANLLEDLCWAINIEMERVPEEVALGIYVEQIKTKFGGLRCYFSHTTPFIEGVIVLAESISLRTCEECGMPGKQRTSGGWIDTLCDTCIEVKDKSLGI